jgi:hypothetical protein
VCLQSWGVTPPCEEFGVASGALVLNDFPLQVRRVCGWSSTNPPSPSARRPSRPRCTAHRTCWRWTLFAIECEHSECVEETPAGISARDRDSSAGVGGAGRGRTAASGGQRRLGHGSALWRTLFILVFYHICQFISPLFFISSLNLG